MSVAWATVAILVFLLPGFLFLTGVGFSERFTRETGPANPLVQLAIVVSISFFVHGLSFVILNAACGGFLPCPRTDYVLATFQLIGSYRIPLAELGENFRRFGGAIFLYVLSTAAASLALGRWTGEAIVRDWLHLGQWARHPWVYGLMVGAREDGFTVAYVVTDLRQDERVLLYRGVLAGFGLGHDGRFRYLVLYEPERFYMHLHRSAPTTGPAHAFDEDAALEGLGEWGEPGSFVIDGERVLNAYFKRYLIDVTEAGERELDEALQTAEAEPPAGAAPVSHAPV